MDFVPIDIAKLVADYNTNPSTRYLASKYGTSPLTIRNKLRKAGVTILSSVEYVTKHRDRHRENSIPGYELTNDILVKLWPDHSVAEIHRRTGASELRIKNLAKMLALPDKSNIKPLVVKFWWDTREWLDEHYNNKNLSLNKLAEIVGSTAETIKRRLRKHKLTIRPLQESIVVWNSTKESKIIRSNAAKIAYHKTKEKLNAGRATYISNLPPVPYKNREWLAQQYETKNAGAIAIDQNVNPVTIKYWLCRHNLYSPQKIRRWTEELREKARQRSLNLWKSDRQRLEIRDFAQRQKISETHKQLWKNPAFRTAQHRYGTGRAIEYRPTKSNKDTITFRSHLECSYAICLDLDDEILYWEYETSTIEYGDGHTYIIDFTIWTTASGQCEHIEVKPAKLRILSDKYSTASKELNWRFISDAEIKLAETLFKNGLHSNMVTLINRWPKHKQQYRAWSQGKDLILPPSWQIKYSRRFGPVYYMHTCVRHLSGASDVK